MKIKKYSFGEGFKLSAHCKAKRGPDCNFESSGIDAARMGLNEEGRGFFHNGELIRFMPYEKTFNFWKGIVSRTSEVGEKRRLDHSIGLKFPMPEEFAPPEGIDIMEWYRQNPKMKELELEFFKAVLHSFIDRSGEFHKRKDGNGKTFTVSNFLYACIHRDEDSPHGHIGFIPIPHGERDNRLLRDGFTREEVSRLHRLIFEIERELKERFPWYHGESLGDIEYSLATDPPEVIKEETPEKVNLSVRETPKALDLGPALAMSFANGREPEEPHKPIVKTETQKRKKRSGYIGGRD